MADSTADLFAKIARIDATLEKVEANRRRLQTCKLELQLQIERAELDKLRRRQEAVTKATEEYSCRKFALN